MNFQAVLFFRGRSAASPAAGAGEAVVSVTGSGDVERGGEWWAIERLGEPLSPGCWAKKEC